MQPAKGLHNQVVKIVVPYYTHSLKFRPVGAEGGWGVDESTVLLQSVGNVLLPFWNTWSINIYQVLTTICSLWIGNVYSESGYGLPVIQDLIPPLNQVQLKKWKIFQKASIIEAQKMFLNFHETITDNDTFRTKTKYGKRLKSRVADPHSYHEDKST